MGGGVRWWWWWWCTGGNKEAAGLVVQGVGEEDVLRGAGVMAERSRRRGVVVGWRATGRAGSLIWL